MQAPCKRKRAAYLALDQLSTAISICSPSTEHSCIHASVPLKFQRITTSVRSSRRFAAYRRCHHISPPLSSSLFLFSCLIPGRYKGMVSELRLSGRWSIQKPRHDHRIMHLSVHVIPGLSVSVASLGPRGTSKAGEAGPLVWAQVFFPCVFLTQDQFHTVLSSAHHQPDRPIDC